ncbi:acyl-CoA N-acyltransferase [Mariannaea sp. PMI_226]|nr:acyl-CoA N-acyltransferase [Mariannaea sp. PMI_226]
MDPSSPVTYRSHRPGDMGLILYQHGHFYSKEYGFDRRFEALVATIAADFLDNFDPSSDRCWIAEREDQFMGSVMLVKDREQEKVAKLRFLLVDSKARGQGVGTQLVRQCIDFAREVGYESVWLLTDSLLTGARKIYGDAGFELVWTNHHNSWGVELTQEKWILKL